MPDGSDAVETQEVPKKAASFTTTMGSVYKYDSEGRTSRFKTATGEQHETQDITVFANISPETQMKLLGAIHEVGDDKVYVLERQENGEGRIIRKREEVKDPQKLYLGIVSGGKILTNGPAVLEPRIGYTVFDTRQFQKDGQRFTERHLGNKVATIEYEQ